MPIQIGDKAPAFTLATLDGSVSLGDLKGKPFVLYFYPKDNTPGCTLEAIDFSKLEKKFAALGAAVIGVSKDGLESHRTFAHKHKLQVTLASDQALATALAYGVWVEKTLYGKKSMGMERATFLIDAKGIIRGVWHKVKVDGHAEAVLAELQQIAHGL